jgi:hypothetical protein
MTGGTTTGVAEPRGGARSAGSYKNKIRNAVFWIRDILVRIQGSVPRPSDPDSAVFVSYFQDAKKSSINFF